MSRCYIVLGMHRSATSMIARQLNDSGILMGETFLQPDSGNPLGYYEDIDFVNLNKQILIQAGGDWVNVPPETKILQLRQDKSLMRRIEHLVKTKSKAATWGWKDPRTVLTIRLYLPYLPEHYFVTCLRDPYDVALSLQKRNQFDINLGMSLATEYNKRLINFMTQKAENWKYK